MTEKEQKLLNESLSMLFKMDPETIASLYNEAGELVDFSKILELDKERIAKYKSESDNQYKRGVKEGATKIEKELKEKYEIDSDLQGIDLVDHLIVQKTEEVKTSSSKDVTKHPDYIKLQATIDKQLKDRDREWEAKIEAKDKEFNKVRIFEKVREKALLNLTQSNPILPEDPNKAQLWKDTYLNALRQADYIEDDEGNLIVLNSEGKALQSAHGKNITFEEFVKETADKYFEYPKATDRSSPGLKPQDGNGGWNAPRTEEEYIARQKDPKITPDERIKLTEYWTTKS